MITKARREEMIEEVKEIQQRMAEDVNALAYIIRELKDRHTEAYLLATLQTAIDADHPYLSNDDNLTKFIHRLEEDNDDDTPDDDDDDDGPEEDEPGAFVQHDDGRVSYRYVDNTEVDLPDEYEPPEFVGGAYVPTDDGRWQYHWPDGSVWSFATGFQPPV